MDSHKPLRNAVSQESGGPAAHRPATPIREEALRVDPMTLDASSDLETVLGAWHDATIRLEHTHEALRSEVRRLTDELENKNRELARKDRLADLGRMASHIAHEVRNSLVPVSLYLTLLRRRTTDDSSLEIVDQLSTAMSQLGTTVSDLLHFTSDREPAKRRFIVADLLTELCESLAPQFRAQRVEVLRDASETAALHADRDMLRRAVLNLILNALDAMPDGGRLFLSAGDAGNACVEITVRDTGPGLSDEAMRRASEPFFSTKNSGTGLGLAIVFRIAEVHGGTVEMDNAADGGAVFTLRFHEDAKELAA